MTKQAATELEILRSTRINLYQALLTGEDINVVGVRDCLEAIGLCDGLIAGLESTTQTGRDVK